MKRKTKLICTFFSNTIDKINWNNGSKILKKKSDYCNKFLKTSHMINDLSGTFCRKLREVLPPQMLSFSNLLCKAFRGSCSRCCNKTLPDWDLKEQNQNDKNLQMKINKPHLGFSNQNSIIKINLTKSCFHHDSPLTARV